MPLDDLSPAFDPLRPDKVHRRKVLGPKELVRICGCEHLVRQPTGLYKCAGLSNETPEILSPSYNGRFNPDPVYYPRLGS